MNTDDEIRSFLFECGDLHDCEVEGMSWSPRGSRLVLSIVDINANFQGLPEYAGVVPVRLEFTGVSAVQVSVSSLDGRLVVYQCSVKQLGNALQVDMAFWPEGNLRVEFADMSFESAETQACRDGS